MGGRQAPRLRAALPVLRRKDTGAPVRDLAPASGGFVEPSFPETGDHPFVTRVMTDAERGAHGIVRVGRP
ncbi:hypothetical protein ADK41_23480 [Streptomyces caelestis]|uniref:Uncharacterized protein n=2 Tax=Streptomyces TaxID=1883 RepID=A0A0N0S5D6_9ACTN|nr:MULTISPECIES: hypothetical protein [Streptomyces]KOT35728.1 hypothetical protein ADK41_23480 [Streptomyces caelestis]KOV32798.1 hypothetical protein ADK58_05730 [Streptomyces sp. XY152]